jgi:hypothetical protein
MLLLDPEKLPSTGTINYVGAFVTNHGAAGVITSRPLSSPECRCGGLSNGIDGRGADSWPKVLIGMAALDDAVHGKKLEETDLVERLFELLRSVHLCVPSVRSPDSRAVPLRASFIHLNVLSVVSSDTNLHYI